MIGDRSSNAGVLSFSKDAIIATSYRDNEIVKGNVFSFGLLITFANTNPLYFSSEIIEGHGLNAAFLLPIICKPTTGYVTLNIYEDTEYSGGTQIYPSNRNRYASGTAKSIIRQGPTGSNKGTLLSLSDVFGTEGGPVNPGGGASSGADSIIINMTKKYLYEITPSETGLVGITAEFAEI